MERFVNKILKQFFNKKLFKRWEELHSLYIEFSSSQKTPVNLRIIVSPGNCKNAPNFCTPVLNRLRTYNTYRV